MPASQPANFNLQEFSDVGQLLVGGRLYTYGYGTTAHKTAFTDPDGTVPHTYTPDGAGGQYIALNARGELPAPLYLADGSYDLALKRTDGTIVWIRKADGVDNSIRSWMASLAASLGASLIGFLQAGAGAVARLVQEKLREQVSVKDFGAKGDGEANDTAAFLKCRTYCITNKATAIVPPGTYLLDAGTNWAANGFHLVGEGSPPTLQMVGAGLGFVLDAGAAGARLEGIRVENFIIRGGPGITHGFYKRGIVRSRFKDIEVRECSASAFDLIFGVSNAYENLKYSHGAYTSATKPARGFILDNSGSGFYCANNTFINCIAEDAPDMIGALLVDASGNTFIGGTFEAVRKGVVIFAGCRRNTFKGIWFELNSESDMESDGILNSFDDCYFGSAPSNPNIVIALGQGTQFRGGYIRTAQLQPTSTGTTFVGVGFDENTGGALGITGGGDYKAVGLLKVNAVGNIVGTMPDHLGENGTWTPSLHGDSTPGAQTYSIQVGRHQKIGKLVHFQAYLRVTSNTGGTGNAVLSGFVYPVASITNMFIEFTFASNTGATFTAPRNRLTVSMLPGDTLGTLIESQGGLFAAAFPIGSLGPGNYVINGSYITD